VCVTNLKIITGAVNKSTGEKITGNIEIKNGLQKHTHKGSSCKLKLI
jgi:hypothetical protein